MSKTANLIIHGICAKLKKKLKKKALDEDRTMKSVVEDILRVYLEGRWKE